MKKHWVPDWLLKGFLVLTAWIFVIAGVARLVAALSEGRIKTRGNHVYSVQESPNAFAAHIGLVMLGVTIFVLLAVASLGFIPRVGRAYKAMIARQLQRQKDRRSKR